MSFIKIGILGCGDHSHSHGKAAAGVDGIKIVSCCDIMEDRVKAWAKKYDCDTCYTDFDEMLGKEKLDGIILCTWPNQHLNQIEKCLSHGIKYILCEKSLALSSEEADKIWNAARKNDALIMEASMYRHHPAIKKLERILSYQDIGPIDSIRATFSNYEPEEDNVPDSERNWRERSDCGGGVAYDWMSYIVNACNHFSGGMPVKAYATGNVSEKYRVINRIHGMIEYDNGIVGIIESSKNANFSEELQLTCAHGILRLPIAWGISGEVKITQQHRKQDWGYILMDTYEIEEANPYLLQLKNFVNVINNKEKIVMPLNQSIINIHTIDALVKSVLHKETVDISIPDFLK